MELAKKMRSLYIWIGITLILSLAAPGRVSGEVQPITEAREKLKGISEEEQKTLEELFRLAQEIEELEREVTRLTGEIELVEGRITKLDGEIEQEEKEYKEQLKLLEQVLISYQRGGPATYLELLLQAENLSGFLDRINLIKDISKNVSELLDSIKVSKQKLSEAKGRLEEEQLKLEQKKEELKEPIREKNRLVAEQEAYLENLKEEKIKYEEHLANLQLMWSDLKEIFSSIVDEFARIIGEGHFTMEDLNISFSLFTIKGSLTDETLNRILKEHSALSEIVFSFQPDNIKLEIPDKSLVLNGRFEISGKSALLFVPESGSFYGMPLEQASIDELFKEGPLIIDFEAVAGDLVMIEIRLDSVEAKEGYLEFRIRAGFSF
jgi:peptidoglycan hydrolase CwlO-like protein